MPRKKKPEVIEIVEPEDTEQNLLPVPQGFGTPQEGVPPVPDVVSILPLRDAVIYPMLVAPLAVGRPASVQMIDELVDENQRMVGILTQRSADDEEPYPEDLHEVGCAAVIRTMVKMPDATRLIIQGIKRFKVVEVVQVEPYIKARIEVIEDAPINENHVEEIEAMRRTIAAIFDQAIRLSPLLPDELRSLALSVTEASVMTDLVAAHMILPIEEKQEILETIELLPRMRRLLEALAREVRVLELSNKVQSEVNSELSAHQREYYLREQLKIIQRELGYGEDGESEFDDLERQLLEAELPEAAYKEARRELDRLQRLNPSSPEHSVARTYLETLVSLPWNKSSEDTLKLESVRSILDDEHYGLEKIKERIVEFLAVRLVKREGIIRQPILCFVGPPGVGKTSLGRSIADSMSRKFIRMSLGGVRDEAEIRGHRRTYIGAMPGQIVQHIRRCGTNNPLFVLDEIDKIGNDFRGDPASALLEVLDPEQNSQFRDHYLDTPFDLSKVFFIATANQLDTIPSALRDRMEVIELGGYTEEEKFHIAVRHLIPKQISEHGLRKGQVGFEPDAIYNLIRQYTREAGVRNLEREIGAVVRRATKMFAEGRKSKVLVNAKFVEQALGAPRFLHDEVAERVLVPGMAIGLAWTPVGGDVLFIETAKFPGTKGLVLTGQLGDVMKESFSASIGYLRSIADKLCIEAKEFQESEIHMHLPSGAVPKDGPSAGITIFCALVSLFKGISIKQRLVMSGEITLTGQVLPVGGIKEKVLAAYRAGATEVILPERNRKDYFEDVPQAVQSSLKCHFICSADELLKLAFSKPID